jgi:polar amino acid transport system ATP-binding protein
VSLTVDAGSVIAIIGRSGSGKSTFLRILNGLERYDAGFIYFDGGEVSQRQEDLRALRMKVGMIFQSFNLFPHLTAGENVMLAPRVVKREPYREAGRRAREMLAKVGLSDKFDAFPDQLSGGQQQRVAIARALAMRPRVLLCDEITSALDPELVGEVLDVVRTLASEGMTLILVTHEMRFAREVCDKLVFMHEGRIHEEGEPDRLFSSPATEELANFVRGTV